MKLQIATSTVEQFGTSENRQFSMKTSRKMFEILSGLYSDTPLAIVRELSTNAVDSHIMAGKDNQPFHIHLPNQMEPWITIQDFGTGISHQDIYDVYTVYGASTKENTNSQIGCLGLGSKAPFAYSDNFTITSTVNGEKRIYNAYFNEQNTPAIALMSTEATTEANGLAVQIPVKETDFARFKNAAEKALRFFNVKPNVSGGVVNWANDKCIFEGTGWQSYANFSYGECFAVMGGVTYPVNVNMVDYSVSELARRGSLVLYFEMGELNFTPSREALDYDEYTVKALNEKLKFVASDFVVKVSAQIKDEKNILDALKAVATIKKNFEFLASQFKDDVFVWNGIDICNPHRFVRNLVNGVNGVACTYSHQAYRRQKLRQSVDIHFDVPWFFDDLKRGGENRVKRHVRNTTNSVMFFNKAAYDVLVGEGFPVENFTGTSTLPKIVRTSGTGTSTPADIKVYQLVDYWRKPWESVEFDPNEAPLTYIVKESKSMDWNVKSKNFIMLDDVDQLKSIMRFAKREFAECVLVAPRNEKHLIDAGAVSFSEWLDELADSIQLPDEDDLILARKYSYNEHSVKRMAQLPTFIKLDKNNPVRVFVERLVKAFENVANIKGIWNYLRLPVVNESKEFDFEKPESLGMRLLIKKINCWNESEVVLLAKELEKDSE